MNPSGPPDRPTKTSSGPGEKQSLKRQRTHDSEELQETEDHLMSVAVVAPNDNQEEVNQEEAQASNQAALLHILGLHQPHVQRYPPDDGPTYTGTDGSIYIFVWICVSGRTQVTQIFIDGPNIEITWHLSIAMQIRVIRWWFLAFGQARYGPGPIRLIWMISVGTRNIDSLPDILSLFMDENDDIFQGGHPPLHIAYWSRLHRAPQLMKELNNRFRIFIHLGRHNDNNDIVARPPSFHPVQGRDISNYTDEQLYFYGADDNRFMRHWASHFATRPTRMPPAVSDADLAALNIHNTQMETNMGGDVLGSLPPNFVTDAMRNFMGMIPRLMSGNGYFDDVSLVHASGAPFVTQIGRLTWCCPGFPRGCPHHCFSELAKVTLHLQECRFLNNPNRFPVITDVASARPTSGIIVEHLTQERSLRTAYFSSADTEIWGWPPMFPIPPLWTISPGNAVDDNYFDRIDDSDQQVRSHVVFLDIWHNQPIVLAAYIETLATYLAYYVQHCRRFYREI